MLLEPPTWYVGGPIYYGGGHFNVGDFGETFDESIHEIESVFNSVPEPSSSFGDGGSFGGGFSGGGFGGGGGDSW